MGQESQLKDEMKKSLQTSYQKSPVKNIEKSHQTKGHCRNKKNLGVPVERWSEKCL